MVNLFGEPRISGKCALTVMKVYTVVFTTTCGTRKYKCIQTFFMPYLLIFTHTHKHTHVHIHLYKQTHIHKHTHLHTHKHPILRLRTDVVTLYQHIPLQYDVTLRILTICSFLPLPPYKPPLPYPVNTTHLCFPYFMFAARQECKECGSWKKYFMPPVIYWRKLGPVTSENKSHAQRDPQGGSGSSGGGSSDKNDIKLTSLVNFCSCLRQELVT